MEPELRQVQFPFVNSSTIVIYPDDISLFSNTVLIGNTMYADYTGTDLSIIDGVPPTVDPVELVNMGDLAELLSQSVLYEIEDFRVNGGSQAIKEAANQVMVIILAGRIWDANSDKFTAFMTKIINATTLTGSEALAIVEEMKVREL